MLNKNENKKADEQEQVTGFKIKLITWNLWSIFMFSPRCLTNPYRCTDYILSVADKEKWTDYDGLIICGFQELWKWNTGIFPSFILSSFVYIFEYIPFFGEIISRIFQAITFIIGIIPIFKILSLFNYCPKQIVITKLSKIFHYAYYDNAIPLLPLFRISDNGLLLLFNQKADLCGSESFNHSKHDDFFANKGFIYAYFEKYHTLFINTHLQYRGHKKVKIAQIKQLNEFIDAFKSAQSANIKIMIFGDFNCDMINHENIMKLRENHENSGLIQVEENRISNKNNEYLDVPELLGRDYVKVNSCKSTTRFEDKCIDHIFVNHKITKYKEKIGGKNKKLSDHYCVINDFYSH